MPEEPQPASQAVVKEEASEQAQHAAHKSRMDKRVSEAETGRASAEQRIHELSQLLESKDVQLKVYADLPEDVQDAALKLADGQSKLIAEKASVQEIAKKTLASTYSTALGVDAEMFLQFDTPQAMRAAYELLSSQRTVAVETSPAAPVSTTAQAVEAEVPSRPSPSGFDASPSGGIFTKRIDQQTSEEFATTLANVKQAQARAAAKRR